MKRLSRLFGRKPEQETEDNQIVNQAEADQDIGETPQVDFGLQFTFESGESRTFTDLPITIGRSEQSDVVLADAAVSAQHAQVYFDDRVNAICIEDRNSLNGLFVDDKPTSKNVLHDGVNIRLGNVNLIFRDTGYIHPDAQ